MLRELQQQFLGDLFSAQEFPLTLCWLADNGRRRTDEQFGTYRESVIAGITAALAETYPVCKQLVGERFFGAMAARFISNHRSYNPDLNAYGQELADFIDSFAPADALPYLADVARLEWAWNSVLDGSEPPPGNLHELDSVADADTQNLRFKLHGNSVLLASLFPVHRIWQVNQKNAEEEEIDLGEGGVQLIIWRDNTHTRMDPLSTAQWQFLSLLQKELPFDEVCAEITSQYEGTDPGELLGSAIQQGWLRGFDLFTSANGQC